MFPIIRAGRLLMNTDTPPAVGLSSGPVDRTYTGLKNARLVEKYVLPWRLNGVETEYYSDGAKT